MSLPSILSFCKTYWRTVAKFCVSQLIQLIYIYTLLQYLLYHDSMYCGDVSSPSKIFDHVFSRLSSTCLAGCFVLFNSSYIAKLVANRMLEFRFECLREGLSSTPPQRLPHSQVMSTKACSSLKLLKFSSPQFGWE